MRIFCSMTIVALGLVGCASKGDTQSSTIGIESSDASVPAREEVKAPDVFCSPIFTPSAEVRFPSGSEGPQNQPVSMDFSSPGCAGFGSAKLEWMAEPPPGVDIDVSPDFSIIGCGDPCSLDLDDSRILRFEVRYENADDSDQDIGVLVIRIPHDGFVMNFGGFR